MQAQYRNPGERLGAENRRNIKEWTASHPGGTQRECAKALGLSVTAVNRHFQKLRAAWRDQQTS